MKMVSTAIAMIVSSKSLRWCKNDFHGLNDFMQTKKGDWSSRQPFAHSRAAQFCTVLHSFAQFCRVLHCNFRNCNVLRIATFNKGSLKFATLLTFTEFYTQQFTFALFCTPQFSSALNCWLGSWSTLVLTFYSAQVHSTYNKNLAELHKNCRILKDTNILFTCSDMVINFIICLITCKIWNNSCNACIECLASDTMSKKKVPCSFGKALQRK